MGGVVVRAGPWPERECIFHRCRSPIVHRTAATSGRRGGPRDRSERNCMRRPNVGRLGQAAADWWGG
jgi:hypothetical protein